VISVRDQGGGYCSKEQVRIFERFYQVASVPGEKPVGAGHDLASCKRTAEAHGGLTGIEKHFRIHHAIGSGTGQRQGPMRARRCSHA